MTWGRLGVVLLAANILAAAAHAAPEQTAAVGPWPNFQIIMWQTKLPAQYKALRALEVTAARVQVDRTGETSENARQNTRPVMAAGLRPYLENAATDFYSAYHRWFPGKPVNWEFLALQQALARSPNDRNVLVRQPSLSDPDALNAIAKRLTQTVRVYARYRPLFTNLGDEPGIADLSAAWDFDFSKSSLAGLRAWLKDGYGSPAALNREWGTGFANWDDVVPPTTTEAMARADGNYAAWSDFKDWMNVSFAQAVAAGTRAIHAGAPGARSAIEGAQMPGWGGYDYSLLANSVDVMEMYDSGGNVEIAQSFNPGLVVLNTSTWGEPDARHQAWREFLAGARGMVLWDDGDDFVTRDGSLAGRGRAAAPFFAAVHGRLGRLLMASEAHRDPVAILYSPVSFRIQWMLDHRALGAAWTRRGAEDENEDNALRAAQRRTLARLAQLGFRARFVSDAQVSQGILPREGYKVLILPQALAFSAAAADAMRGFVRSGGTLISDGSAGLYDGHGRRLGHPQLDDLFTAGSERAVQLPDNEAGASAAFARALKASGIVATARVENASGEPAPDVRQYVYHNGPATLVALLGDSAKSVTLALGQPAYAYDAVSGAFLGRSGRLTLTVASDTPAVIALVEKPLDAAGCKSLFLVNCAPARP